MAYCSKCGVKKTYKVKSKHCYRVSEKSIHTSGGQASQNYGTSWFIIVVQVIAVPYCFRFLRGSMGGCYKKFYSNPPKYLLK